MLHLFCDFLSTERYHYACLTSTELTRLKLILTKSACSMEKAPVRHTCAYHDKQSTDNTASKAEEFIVASHEEVRITKQPNLTVILQSRHLSSYGHVARMDDDTDAKMILIAPPPENWKRPSGRLYSLYHVAEHRPTRSESL